MPFQPNQELIRIDGGKKPEIKQGKICYFGQYYKPNPKKIIVYTFVKGTNGRRFYHPYLASHFAVHIPDKPLNLEKKAPQQEPEKKLRFVGELKSNEWIVMQNTQELKEIFRLVGDERLYPEMYAVPSVYSPVKKDFRALDLVKGKNLELYPASDFIATEEVSEQSEDRRLLLEQVISINALEDELQQAKETIRVINEITLKTAASTLDELRTDLKEAKETIERKDSAFKVSMQIRDQLQSELVSIYTRLGKSFIEGLK